MDTSYSKYRRDNLISSLHEHYETLAAASKAFREDKERVIAAVANCQICETDYTILKTSHTGSDEDDDHDAKETFQRLRDAVDSFKERKEDFLNVIRKYSREISFAPQSFQEDEEVIDLAARLHGHALSSFEVIKRSSSGLLSTLGSSAGASSSASVCSNITSPSFSTSATTMFFGGSSRSIMSTTSSISTTIASNYNNDYNNNKDIERKKIEYLWFKKEEYCDHLTQKLKNEQEERTIISAIKETPEFALKYIRQEFKSNRNIILHSIRRNGCSIKYASDVLRRDKHVALAAVRQNSDALKYISQSLQNDQEIILAAIRRKPSVVKYASDSIKNNKEIMIQVVQNDGRLLKHCSETLRDDIDIVLSAIRNHGRALQYASESLRSYQDIVQEAMKEDPFAWNYASDAIKYRLDVISISAFYLKMIMKDHESFTLEEFLTLTLMKSIDLHSKLEDCEQVVMACRLGLRWIDAIETVEQNDGDKLNCLDKKTNLFPFMLAASSNADLDTIYIMVKKSVDLIKIHDMQEYTSMIGSYYSCACS